MPAPLRRRALTIRLEPAFQSGVNDSHPNLSRVMGPLLVWIRGGW